jgi:hypothetical protein
MKDWTEHIEEYINGELSPSDTQAFNEALKIDADLQAELALGKLMIEAINKTGELELREYLKKNTQVKAASKINYLWASGAIAAMMICGFFVYKSYFEPVHKAHSYYGFDDESELLKEEEVAANEKLEEPVPTFEEDYIIDTTELLLDSNGLALEIEEGRFKDFPAGDYESKVLAPFRNQLSQVSVIPIPLQSAPEVQTVDKSKYDYSNSQGRAKETTVPKKMVKDTNKKTSTAKVLANKNGDPSQFNLSFFENNSDTISINSKKLTSNIVKVELDNVSSDNPQILLYNNLYYLKAGDDYYLLNINGKTSSKAKVTNKELLKILAGTSEE